MRSVIIPLVLSVAHLNMRSAAAAVVLFPIALVTAYPYDEAETALNLNGNPDASNPLEYTAVWENHTYYPSRSNWRFPFEVTSARRNGQPGVRLILLAVLFHARSTGERRPNERTKLVSGTLDNTHAYLT